MADSPSRPTDWARSPRGRRELLAVTLFVAVSLLVPVLTTELFPFSRAPMFADAPRLYCTYQVFDPDGKALDAVEFGVQRNYWGNPLGVGVGFQPPPSVDTFGKVASREEVEVAVRGKLAARPDLAYVDVVQQVTGPVDEQAIGVVGEQRWRVRQADEDGR